MDNVRGSCWGIWVPISVTPGDICSVRERKWASHVHDRTRHGIIKALSSPSGRSHMRRNGSSANCMFTSHLPWPRDIWDSGVLSQLQDGLDLRT